MARPLESTLQGLIHSIEQGSFRLLVQYLLIVIGTLAIAISYLGLLPFLPWQYRGLSLPEAMDQAQISREISRGHGFSTLFLRPLAIKQLEHYKGAPFTGDRFPDTFNAPLGPLVNAPLMHWFGEKKVYKNGEFTHPAERAMAILAMVFLIGAVIIHYFLLRRLFDGFLALATAGLVLVCDLCWQFALSGLPQMLMLFIFSGVLYAITRAIEARDAHLESGGAHASTPLASLAWLVLAGVGLGLLGLAHGVALWLTAGAALFAGIHFRPRVLAMVILAGACALVYAPWLIRNYRVTGTPFALAGCAMYDDVRVTTAHRMRSFEAEMQDPPYFLHVKTQSGIINQFGWLVAELGGSLLAPAFLLGLLHPFKRPAASALRWAVLFMWLFAVFGMALLGTAPAPLYPAQMSVLFIPVMTGYGLALVLVLFGRLAISRIPLMRILMLVLLFLASAAPLISSLVTKSVYPVNYPPYFPGGIATIGAWTAPAEITGSDMPWAVAWYADRRSLWFPIRLRDFMGLSDAGELPGPLTGLLLSPISRDGPFISSILSGENQDWLPLIVGNPAGAKDFPFRQLKVLPPGGYVYYNATPVWEKAPSH